MKMKRVSSVFCALAVFGTASLAMAGAYGEAEQPEEMPRPAPAQEVVETDEFAPFPYIAAGAVYGQEYFEGDVHQINDTYGWGWNARAGYRFMEMLAVELLAEHIAEFDSDGGGSNSTDRRAWSLMPNLKVFPIQGFAEPYVSVGAGLFRGDHGHNYTFTHNGFPYQGNSNGPSGNGVDQGYGFGMRFGGGVDLYATENLFVEAELAYMLPLTEDINNYNYLSVSLGLGYAFN